MLKIRNPWSMLDVARGAWTVSWLLLNRGVPHSLEPEVSRYLTKG